MIVAKFGGTSVANLRRIERCMAIVKKISLTEPVVVVVSAMAGVTNKLQQYVDPFETSTFFHDLVISSGEQITVGLFCLMMEKYGLKPKSFLGWQVPIITSSVATNAIIQNIPVKNVQRAIKEGYIPVIAGFQGVTTDNQITTLGRGGSDTTAVYLAYYLKARECQIYSDVEGVYSSDPNMISTAQRLNYLTYEEMFELSHCGAKVLQIYAAQKALEKKVNLRLLSSFIESEGTLLTEDIKEKARFASLYIRDHKGFLIGKNIDQLKNIKGKRVNANVIQIDPDKQNPKSLHDSLLNLI